MEKETIITENGTALHVEKKVLDSLVECRICADDTDNCILHWGLRRRGDPSWQAPPESSWPEGSRPFDEKAVQSPFSDHGCVTIRLAGGQGLRSVDFVLFFPGENRWDNNRGKNYRIEFPGPPSREEALLGSRSAEEIAEEIIEHETSRNSWTLMHRFNLCYDLLDKAQTEEACLAVVFVWLRYSFIRQLEWQRHYNTKPRELGHAMDRLTLKLAGIYGRETSSRGIVRLIMTTLGRGSDAQRVRDEVLNIMHRHHIKEVSGHFMEEWHQKLHNNTTPDDIVICEAYLDFLRSNGDLDRFYRRLADGGVTKERLESYERPIRSHPDFIPHLKDPLIGDFEHFLGILKAVHAGADLGTAIHAARYLFDAEMHQLMDFIWHHHNDGKTPVGTLAEKIIEARRRLGRLLTGHQDRVRDLLFLDIALEDFLRISAERRLAPEMALGELFGLGEFLVENLALSEPGEEMLDIGRQWERLGKLPRHDREWLLRAKAAADRMTEAASEYVDGLVRLLQPKAEFLGNSFHAASWAVDLFSEEVVRGRPVFALSLLLRYLDPAMRKAADIGDWQVISPAEVTAFVEEAETLRSVQGKSFSRPTLLVAGHISGDEEIPDGVVAIVTGEAVDILAHLSVRARNSGVLFATCYDSDIVGQLQSLRGRTVRAAGGGGNVVFEEAPAGMEIKGPAPSEARRPVAAWSFTSYAVAMQEFNDRNVGGKSGHLKELKGKLPEWIELPASAAIPFGVFEKVLGEKMNSEAAATYRNLLSRLDDGGGPLSERLSDLREAISHLRPPDILVSSLREACRKSGIRWPEDWEGAWNCIRKVWASKWNERAYLSRRSNGIPHDSLVMAVLIQEVVDAEYSYVIHTVNPFSGAKEEIYAEAARGLGEALVGNYPGRALSFSSTKGTGQTTTITFPSKRKGLFGGGLIFRSDSNGEDLAGFAGAGLYDSFLLPAPRKATLAYRNDPLLWDDRFRKEFESKVAEIGTLVEEASGSPQDIEGAYAGERYYVVQTRPQVGVKNE